MKRPDEVKTEILIFHFQCYAREIRKGLDQRKKLIENFKGVMGNEKKNPPPSTRL